VIAAIGVLAPLARNPPSDSFDGYLASAGMNFRLTRGRVLAVEQPPTRYHAFLERGGGEVERAAERGRRGEAAGADGGVSRDDARTEHELSDEQNAEFMHSGTMHLFAINGLHIGVVAMALHALLAVLRCPRPIAAVVTARGAVVDVDTTARVAVGGAASS